MSVKPDCDIMEWTKAATASCECLRVFDDAGRAFESVERMAEESDMVVRVRERELRLRVCAFLSLVISVPAPLFCETTRHI